MSFSGMVAQFRVNSKPRSGSLQVGMAAGSPGSNVLQGRVMLHASAVDDQGAADQGASARSKQGMGRGRRIVAADCGAGAGDVSGCGGFFPADERIGHGVGYRAKASPPLRVATI
jgi:hypothetical protein